MGISDAIARFILESLTETGGAVELQRGELAQMFGCVPSQINYVISTRFSPEHGYIVESRRGGNGFIRISRVSLDRQTLIMHTINAAGYELDARSAAAFISNLLAAGAISDGDAALIAAVISENSLRPAPPQLRPGLRASIFKHALLNV